MPHSMDAGDFPKIRQLFDDYLRMYSSRDDRLTTYFSEDFSGFTGGGDVLVKDREEWVAITRQDFAQIKDPIRIELKDVAIQSLAETIAVATGFFAIHLPIKDHVLSRETARLVLIFRKESLGWKISHSSISIPYYLVQEGEIYPLKELIDRNEFLEEQVAERTIQLSGANHNLQQANHELAREIAAHEQAEAALRQSEAEFRAMFETASIGMAQADPRTGQWLRVNQKMCAITGYSTDELLRLRVPDLTHPEDRPRDGELFQSVVQGEAPDYRLEKRYVRKDGSLAWVNVNMTVLRNTAGQPLRTLATIEDISERKRAEQTLRTSEERFRLVFRHSAAGMVLVSPDFYFLEVNDAFCKMLGCTESELLGKTFQDVTLPEDRPVGGELVRRVLSGEMATFHFEKRYLHKDGTVVWGLASSMLIRDSQNQPLHFVTQIQDITERKRAEEALRESEGKYRVLIENAGEAIVVVQEGRFVFGNSKAAQFVGCPLDAALAQPFLSFVHPDDRALVRERYEQRLHGVAVPSRYEFRLTSTSGQTFWVELNAVLIDWKGAPATLNFLSDLTERKRAEAEKAQLEAQFQQAQKMESIGQLAGGVAHDFNNVLAATMMRLSLLQRNQSLDHETQESLKELMAEAKRAADLTRQLLLFSRRSGMELTVLDLNELVATLLKMLGRLIGEHITVQFNRCEGLPAVEADPGMIEQVLMNLSLNARDAMPEGGRIDINIEPIQIDADRVKGNIQGKPGPFVCLTVADTGCGMDEITLQRIFEPFFTTKEVGKGTGLGLATVDGIVAQHKGWVEVASELGKGSTFKVFLPATTKATTAPTQPGKTAVIRGHETILVVEDEASVRQVVTQGLRLLGYRVLEAGEGREAMKLWQEHGQEIDLLFSDMMMPEGLTGLDLAEKLRTAKPNLKVLISSGYHAEMAGRGRPAAAGIMYLQKPYQFDVLWKTIRECLDRA